MCQREVIILWINKTKEKRTADEPAQKEGS
jgi:hypothetical protein